MTTPTSPQTATPIITTELQGSPEYTIDQVDGAPIQYRIEERRRTIYVTSSSVPPLELDHQTLNELFQLANVPEMEDGGLQSSRRTKSQEEPRSASSLSSRDRSDRQDYAMESPTRTRASSHRKRPGSTSARSSPVTSPTTYSIQKSWTFVKPPPILFYHKHEPHYGFTNFSNHPVWYQGRVYPTSEHLFQSFKFLKHRPSLAEHIRTCSDRPSVAFSEARRFQPEVRKDWMAVNIEKMDKALWYKFTQHQDLQDELLSTGEADLVEDSDKDAFWGVGADGSGRNELGKALVRLRAKLRTDSSC